MSNASYTNQKKPLVFSRNQIDKAARDIRHGCEKSEDKLVAIQKVQNYREFHLYPLMLIKNHLARTSAKVNGNIIVARRLKRLSTIIDKLERPTLDGVNVNAIKLTRMQDIAGCRAIVKNIAELKALESRLQKSKSVHKIVKQHDYLTPKESGYGGVHLVYSCYENQNEDHPWKKSKVEVQLRTDLQHAWATSLEIIDTLEQISLKTRLEGHEDWREFFSLAGKLVANDEGACVIPEDELQIYIQKFVNLERELKVRKKLNRYRLAIDFTTRNAANPAKRISGMSLVTFHKALDMTKEKQVRVRVRHFDRSASDEALEELNQADLDTQILLAVLVSAPDVRALKKAYPNYFGSTQKFVKFIDKQFEKHTLNFDLTDIL